MGARGPSRKPGSIRWSKNRDAGVKTVEGAVSADVTVADTPPAWLCAAGKRVYRETALELLAAGVKLLSVDSHALAMFANAIVNMQKANMLVRKEGMTVSGPRGGVVQHPAIRLADRYSRESLAWARQLGCTPESRSRWEITEPDFELDHIEAALSRPRKRMDPIERALCGDIPPR